MTAESHTDRAHARLSPSGASRWFACPGSAAAEEGFPRMSDIHADEGTAAHTLAESCLRANVDPGQFLDGHVNIKDGTVHKTAKSGKDIFTIDEEMVDGVRLYVETVKSLIEEGDEYEFEAKLDLRHIDGMEFGTGDFVRYRPSTKHVAVADLKYGRSVAVRVKENKQLLTYGEGTARRFHNRGLSEVQLVVVQPRRPPPKEDSDVKWLDAHGHARSWTLDVLDMVEFRATIGAAAKATMAKDAPRIPGDHCRWCKAGPTCEALKNRSMAIAEMEFAEEPPKVASMDAERIADLMPKVELLEIFAKAVKQRGHEIAAADGLPGFKLVHSTSHRKWKDEAGAVKYLQSVVELEDDDIYTDPKVRSPAQIEKTLGAKRKKEIEGLIHKPPGKVILVPNTDPREPARPDASSEFGDD